MSRKENFWDALFTREGLFFGDEPSDSTFRALKLFRKLGIRKVLVPGFGYGRNANLFIKNGMDVTGIEISSAGIALARSKGISCCIHAGSVVDMPYDSDTFGGVYCYALLHLLGKGERKQFLEACYRQLEPNGYMVFTLASKAMSSFGTGTRLSKDRYLLENGLRVFFYDDTSAKAEFQPFGLISVSDIAEPIKFRDGEPPLDMKYVVCQKKVD